VAYVFAICRRGNNLVEPIATQWSIKNEAAKQSTIAHIVAMSRNPAFVDHARERAKEIVKDWPEFLGLLKQGIENEKKTYMGN
jgi:hypothetical protein